MKRDCMEGETVFNQNDVPDLIYEIADAIEERIGHPPKHLVVIAVNQEGMAQTLCLSQDANETFVRLIREASEQRQKIVDGTLPPMGIWKR